MVRTERGETERMRWNSLAEKETQDVSAAVIQMDRPVARARCRSSEVREFDRRNAAMRRNKAGLEVDWKGGTSERPG